MSMAANLLDSAKIYLTDDVVSQVSTMLGEDRDNTQKAFGGALPILMSGILQKSAEPGGNGSIMDMVGQASTPDYTAGDITEPVGGLSGNLNAMLADDLQSERMRSMGAGMVHSLFGDRTSAVTAGLAAYSGLSQPSASSLMGVAGPLLFSVLGQEMADKETGVSGLSELLTSQANSVQEALPSGLGSLAGFGPELETLAVLDSLPDMPTATPADPFSSPVPVTEFVSPTTVPEPVIPVTADTRPITHLPPDESVTPVTFPTYINDDNTSAGTGNR